jgi:hypothetical protein
LSKECSRRRKQKGKAQGGPSIIGSIKEMRGITTVCVVQLARFIVRTILAVALTFACLDSDIAQAQELTAHEPSAAENDSAAEAIKQAANPLANAWLMQVQQIPTR